MGRSFLNLQSLTCDDEARIGSDGVLIGGIDVRDELGGLFWGLGQIGSYRPQALALSHNMCGGSRIRGLGGVGTVAWVVRLPAVVGFA